MTSVSARFTTVITASKRAGVFEDMYIFYNKQIKKITGKRWALGKCEQFETVFNIRKTAGTLDDNELKLKVGNYKFNEGRDFVVFRIRISPPVQERLFEQSTRL